MGDSNDIRRWFLKQPHAKSNVAAPSAEKDTDSRPDLKKTSKYFSKEKPSVDSPAKPTPEKSPLKRKQQVPASPKVAQESKPKGSCSPSPKKQRTVERQSAAKAREETPEDDDDFEDAVETPTAKPAGRGRGRGASASSPAEDKKPTPAGRGRGGGGGRGAFFAQPRQTPPHKGEKEIPEGADDCLSGRTFVISGTLDSLEREEAEDLIKRHGGRITTSVSKKTSYLLADEDVGGRKSQKAKELGVPFLTEDGLLDIIRNSKPKKSSEKPVEVKPIKTNELSVKSPAPKPSSTGPAPSKTATPSTGKRATLPSNGNKSKEVAETEAWPQKHRPRSIAEIVGNQSIVKQLHDWLKQWHAQNLQRKDQKGKKRTGDSNNKKAVLMSGPPGIGKTTSARLISKMLGFEPFEVNASDSRGKSDSNVVKGMGGSTSNAIKEMVSNESIGMGGNSNMLKKAVLIMDEVDGMSGGDRGGVADLIASIKISKIPIICICNDRYSQKLKSLVNYCLPLNFRKPTKQQMAKRLLQIAQSEGMQADEIALEELSERVNGDLRMALNELQYMSLQSRVIKFNDVKARLGSSGKDEDMSPFNAVDRLMSYEGGRLRMDERMDASMSDPDLVPLLIQENYINYCPAIAGRDDNGTARLDLIAKAAASIADGDIVNSQIRQYRQWQHSQMAAFMSSIIPAALMHGRRETLLPGERNFNRFGGWLGKNSSYGKKMRLLDDVHVHLSASRVCEPTRQAVRRDYLHVIALHLTAPLKTLPKEEAVETVKEFMETYSLTQEDTESILDLIKFQGQSDPMAGVPPAVKSALTKAYKQMENERKVKSSDLLPVFNPTGQKKLPKKRSKLEIIPNDIEGEAEDDGDEESLETEEDETENSDGLAALESNPRIQLTLNEDKSKAGSKKGKTQTGSKSAAGAKQTSTKRPAKETTNSKPAKRRKEG